MSKFNYRLSSENIKDLIPPMGYCIASDKITIDGMKVGYMYREKSNEKEDSGWRFLSGTETQEYVDNEKNSMILDVNVIANYDSDIIPYLKLPIGTELEKKEGTNEFVKLI